MSNRKIATVTLASALAGAVSLAAAVAPTTAYAGSKVKCYGISKAGENDCANSSGTHACAGQASIDYDGGEWKLSASAEACAESGGKTTPFDGVNKAKKM